MAKRRAQKSANTSAAAPYGAGESAKSFPSIPAAELLSFLKEIRAAQTWTEKDLSKALNIALAQANEAISVLELQGYIEPAGRTGRWRMTEAGDLVSGAKSPRFTRESVEEALAALRDRIKAVNDDPDAAYKITEAVAFGDFLRDQSRVQAADVGIRLQRRADAQSTTSAIEHAAELAFLKQLRGKIAFGLAPIFGTKS